MDSYTALARFYEFLQADCDYDKWSQYVCKIISKSPNSVGVDVGAGTGIITRALKKAGYDVSGTDVSDEMLSQAYALSDGQIPFYKQSADKLTGFNNLGFITAVNDVVNYLNSLKTVEFFKRAYKALADGGIFTFDISSPYKLKNVLGNEMFGEDTEDVSYLWFNTLKSDRVIMDITVFSLSDDGRYDRLDERHVQYIHEKEFILNALKEVGFIDVKVTGHLGAKLKDDSLRMVFTAKK